MGNDITLGLDQTTLNVTNNFNTGYHGGLDIDDSQINIGGDFVDNTQTGSLRIDNSSIKTTGHFKTASQTSLKVKNSEIEVGLDFGFIGPDGSNLDLDHTTLTVGGKMTIYNKAKAKFINESALLVNGSFTNMDEAETTFDNSSLELPNTTTVLFNGFHAKMEFSNGSTATVSGDLQTEDGSKFTAEGQGTSINVGGDINNDFQADFNIEDGASFYVAGDFNNGINPQGGEVTRGIVNINGGTLTVGNDFNNDYGSNVDISDGGLLDIGNDINNDQAGSMDFGDGTIRYDGDINDPFNGVNGGDCPDGCCGTGCTPLPVSLIKYTATLSGSQVLNQWTSASEINNDYYTISRSFDGETFTPLATINGAGSKETQTEYSWVDTNFGMVRTYYQLSQTDFDGNQKVLDIKMIAPESNNTNETIILSPNPVTFAISYITIKNMALSNGTYEIVNMQGKTLIQSGFKNNRISINDLSPGVYLVNIQANNSTYKSKFLIL
ncbi:T9SS type A sorting domain-containing protein [Fulvivirga maritima]|uniref:T9SS type A sorting domain-containing protein n=1 Tax=Fulvivirga maritima TaxID=2904247 RepID=UPI001F312792|nr:T9SS type A sorting domain-containing protein [Fulvivirga maritima]UII25439.1 T9SS type A sorting domain-containing protein [Fulvivirga maritima]